MSISQYFTADYGVPMILTAIGLLIVAGSLIPFIYYHFSNRLSKKRKKKILIASAVGSFFVLIGLVLWVLLIRRIKYLDMGKLSPADSPPTIYAPSLHDECYDYSPEGYVLFDCLKCPHLCA